MTYHYNANDIGPSWELMKQDLPDNRTRTLQEQIDALEERYVAKVRDQDRLETLRAKLTSWPALFFKRYEVARALALGWWYQLRLDLVAVAIAILLVAVCGWLSVR